MDNLGIIYVWEYALGVKRLSVSLTKTEIEHSNMSLDDLLEMHLEKNGFIGATKIRYTEIYNQYEPSNKEAENE